jgi:virulence-associated protein VapD
MARKTISDIKYRHEEMVPGNHFFSRATLKFFNQTMRDFRVYKISENLFRVEYDTICDIARKNPFKSTKEKFFNWTSGKFYFNLEDAMEGK